MYVRLAFGVAAHLEPEILIVDEVLAVGDAEFQKKAMGKMKDVSTKEGRTVLFVSHNMSAVQNLCVTALILKNGQIAESGNVHHVMNSYINSAEQKHSGYTRRWGNKKAQFLDYKLCDSTGAERVEFFMGDSLYLYIKVKFNEKIRHADIGINIKNNLDDLISHVANFDDNFLISGDKNDVQEYKIELKDIFFSPNLYNVDIAIVSGSDHFEMLENVFRFSIIEGSRIRRGNFPSHIKIFTKSNWEQL